MSNQFSHPWTKEEISFLRTNIGKLTYQKMGSIINRTYSSIQSKIRHLPFQRKVKKHPVNSDFFKKWSREMAYALGFIAADGNICFSGRAHTLHIACDDIEVLEKIKGVMSYSGPIYRKPRSNGKISHSLRICDQIIFNDLQKLGITERKSLTLTPKVRRVFISDFLRGYFDGDGTVYLRNIKYPSRLGTVFYTASKHMAEFIHSSLKKLIGSLYQSNIRVQMSKHKQPYYSLSLGQRASEKLFSLFYANTTLYMERKYQKFLQGIKSNAR